MTELDHCIGLQCPGQHSHHFRLVGIRTIIKIPDDLLSQGVKRFCFVHFFHGIHDNITGNDLIFPAGIKIALKSFLIERQQMDPQDLLSLEFRIILNILDHKPDQIQKFLSPDKKVHAHHHIKMADQLSGIVSFTLEPKKLHQRPSGLILYLYSLPELFFLKFSAEATFQLPGKIF